jgi:hypothetical protein
MYEEIVEQIKLCKQKILDLSESVNDYIDEHDKYFFNNERDAELLKEKIKEKIARVLNEA